MDVLLVIDEILRPLEYEINELRQEVFYSKTCGRSWEKSLQKFDELLIRKNQTDVIRAAIAERLNSE